MSNTIIGRVKSFKDYWIHLKGYYWSIQLEIAVWIYYPLKRILLENSLKLLFGFWIKEKRAGFGIYIHSLSLNQAFGYLVSFAYIYSSPFYIHMVACSDGYLIQLNSTQLNSTAAHSFNMKILICCIGACNNCTNEDVD